MDNTKGVVVGAGLAGLASAHELEARGLSCTLLERDQGAGGRVQTDVVDGFRLDRGFQVLLTAYPETRRLLDTGSLRLRSFFPGALIRYRERFALLADPWRRPLPAQLPPVIGDRSPRLRKGLYVCGDHWHDASINGAIASGRRAAEAVIRDLFEERQ